MMKPVMVGEKPLRMRRRLLASAWALCLVLGAGLCLTPAARAADPAYLDLQVTFSGTLSVAVDGQTYSTRTFSAGPNALVVASSATVTNTSNGLTSAWEL